MSELAYLSLADAGELIRQKKLSPVEYTTALMERNEAIEPQLHAFIKMTPDLALGAARQAEADIATGNYRGPLHGVPFALKDIIDAAGIATTCHSKIMQNNIAKTDACVTTKLTQGGGVLMGKTATHEFAIGGPSFDLPWPPARNPWDTSRFTGGSSSGSGAAVAAGMVPAALGSDTGGSVRNPASLCGIVGMKPTYGRVSRRGVFPLSYTLDHIGPLTRTVEDNAIMLAAIAGPDTGDPASADAPFTADGEALRAGIKGCRVGVIRRFYQEDFDADPAVASGIENALSLMQALGAETVGIDVPPLQEFAAVNRVILLSEAYAIHEKWLQERPEDYGALCRARISGGAFIRAADYVNATRMRAKLAHAFNECFKDVDVVVTASSMDPPLAIEDAEAMEVSYGRQARAPFNLTGNPALSVPAGFTDDGLPLSIQIIGKPFDEASVYRVAYAYEQAAEWYKKHPTIGVA